MNFYDFRGGYASELTPERMDDNMLLIARNLHYDGSLKQRPGWTNLSVDATLHAGTLRGFARVYMNSTWVNIVALDDGSFVHFYSGNTGAYTVIDAGFHFTKGIDVQMAVLNNMVVAVNGTEKPALIYYSSGYLVTNLETYDIRTRGDDEWYAGYYDIGEALPFEDDTTDAQSTTADDFLLATGAEAGDDGFYVSGVSVFNKVILRTCDDFDGSPVATYKYYAGAGVWTALTTTTTPSWTADAGDKTLEFDLPLDSDGVLAWKKYGDVSTQVDPTGASGSLLNRYVLLVQFTTAPTSTMYCNYLSIYHTQYLTQIMLNDRPHLVVTHGERLYLIAGNAFRFGKPNSLLDWDSQDIEWCSAGGEKIITAVSADDHLALFKESAVYRWIGTTTDNFVLKHTLCPGATSARGAALVSGLLLYVSQDGIRGMVDGASVILSRHIQAVFDAWTKTNAVLIEWRGNALISFPTNTQMLWADPDTVRKDDMGDGRLSFWDWTGLAASQLTYASGSGDNGHLIGWDVTNKRFVRNTAVGYDVAFDTTETAVTVTLQSKYASDSEPTTKKTVKRIKIEVSKSGTWTATFYANDGQASATATIASGTGTGHYTADILLPYTVDGYNLSVKLVNATTATPVVHGFSTDLERRKF